MNIAQIKNAKPMRYWSAKDNNATKLQAELDNYIAVKKMDGFMYRAVLEADGDILQSRTASAKDGAFVEKQANVPHIMEALQCLPKDTVLVGEICYMDSSKTSKDVTKIMGSLPAKALERQASSKLYYYIFDVLYLGGEQIHSKPYKQRLEILQIMFANYGMGEYIIPAEVGEPSIIDGWLASGYEGGVLMHKEKPYVLDKSSAQAWTTVKIKQQISLDLDAVVMDTLPPTKEYNGKYIETWELWECPKTGNKMQGQFYGKGYTPISKAYFYGFIGGLQLGCYYGNTLVEVARVANLTEELASQGKNFWVGKVVKFSGMSVDNVLKSIRHPKFVAVHGDKNANECLYEDIFG